MKTKEMVIPGALALSMVALAVAGGIAVGEAGNQINQLQAQVERQEKINDQVRGMDKTQGIIHQRIESLTTEQREFRADTRRALEQIGKTLNNMSRGTRSPQR